MRFQVVFDGSNQFRNAVKTAAPNPLVGSLSKPTLDQIQPRTRRRDEVNMESELWGQRIEVQVKRRSDKTTIDGIRSLLALLGEGDVGLFVSTGGFTRDAEDEARRQENRRIMLVDLKRLDLWVEHYADVPDEYRRLLSLKPAHFLVPDEE